MKSKLTRIELADDMGNDLLSDIKVNNMMEEITFKIIDDINKKREKVIIERLKAVTGIDLDVEKEAKRRFKRLASEGKGNVEKIFFNDGSIDGILIVTFIKEELPPKFSFDKYEMSIRYSYY